MESFALTDDEKTRHIVGNTPQLIGLCIILVRQAPRLDDSRQLIQNLTGAILASWTTFGCQDYQSEWAWRVPSVLQAGFPLVQLCFYAWVPESPRWLVARERTTEAAAILAKYHSGIHVTSEGHTPLVSREVAEIVQTIQQEKSAETTGWMALVSTPGNRKRTLIAVCVGAFAQ